MNSKRGEPVQASRLIPRNTFAKLGCQENGPDNNKIAQLIDLRLPGNLSNCIRLQPIAFNEDTYKVESNVSFKDEKGILNTKRCNLANFIRWRYAKNSAAAKPTKEEEKEMHKLETQVGLESKITPKVSLLSFVYNFANQLLFTLQIESNTKVVEWSDGSKSLIIGD